MYRDVQNDVLSWKNDSTRRPLILRGARQVGKTYTILDFGMKEFRQVVTLNFDKNPEYKEIFQTLEPLEILEKIQLYTQKELTPGKSLLFLDEIQECPKAISALRYFYEEMPQLHITAAGSLLEFTLHSENFKMPVGRVQYLYMYPLSFGEFLEALGEGKLRSFTLSQNNMINLPEALEKKLTEYLRKYFLLGGMPAVIREYITSRSMKGCQKIQRIIIDTYKDDFAKYSKKIKHKYLQKVFHAVPSMIGQKFVYSHVDSTVKSRELKGALELLEMAGIIYRVSSTSGAGTPLEYSAKENYFKTIFLDIGLMHAINNIYLETTKATDLTDIFKGSVAEQFVGQEFIGYSPPYQKLSLFYWVRDARNSTAEVDYLIEKKGAVIPVEVKSGTTGRLKSLHMFTKKYKSKRGMKISQGTLKENNTILSIPFYHIEGYLKS